MPYIDPADRHQFDDLVDLLGEGAKSQGELTYIISRLLHVYIYENNKDESYAGLAEVLSTLETCKLEYYINTMRPYENYKRETNGDLFDHIDPREAERPSGDGGNPTEQAESAFELGTWTVREAA